MPRYEFLLSAIAQRVPAPIVRAIGRQSSDHRLIALIERMARFAISGIVVIPRGEAAGLSFDASDERPGFGLGTWEPDVQATLAGLLAPGHVVYDVGAAAGFYTLIAARRVSPGGRVVAFEPVAASAGRLRHNVALNNFENVAVLELALSDSPGKAVIIEGAQPDQAVVSDRQAEGTVEIEVATVDGLVADGIPAPDVIKLDVEGGEIAVLRGAADTLTKHQPILVVEVHGTWAELRPLLAAHGYRYRPIESGQSLADPAHIVARV